MIKNKSKPQKFQIKLNAPTPSGFCNQRQTQKTLPRLSHICCKTPSFNLVRNIYLVQKVTLNDHTRTFSNQLFV